MLRQNLGLPANQFSRGWLCRTRLGAHAPVYTLDFRYASQDLAPKSHQILPCKGPPDFYQIKIRRFPLRARHTNQKPTYGMRADGRPLRRQLALLPAAHGLAISRPLADWCMMGSKRKGSTSTPSATGHGPAPRICLGQIPARVGATSFSSVPREVRQQNNLAAAAHPDVSIHALAQGATRVKGHVPTAGVCPEQPPCVGATIEPTGLVLSPFRPPRAYGCDDDRHCADRP
jgi:hypothetical protein